MRIAQLEIVEKKRSGNVVHDESHFRRPDKGKAAEIAKVVTRNVDLQQFDEHFLCGTAQKR